MTWAVCLPERHQLADVPKPYFLSRLADFGVNTFDLSEEELENDIKNA